MGAGKMDRVHKGFGAGRNLVWIICVPIVLLVLLLRPLPAAAVHE